MTSIILASGQGLPMKSLSYMITIVLSLVKGKPILDHLLINLNSFRTEDCIVVYELYTMVQNYLEKTKIDNVSIIKGPEFEAS